MSGKNPLFSTDLANPNSINTLSQHHYSNYLTSTHNQPDLNLYLKHLYKENSHSFHQRCLLHTALSLPFIAVQRLNSFSLGKSNVGCSHRYSRPNV